MFVSVAVGRRGCRETKGSGGWCDVRKTERVCVSWETCVVKPEGSKHGRGNEMEDVVCHGKKLSTRAHQQLPPPTSTLNVNRQRQPLHQRKLRRHAPATSPSSKFPRRTQEAHGASVPYGVSIALAIIGRHLHSIARGPECGTGCPVDRGFTKFGCE